ncbi:MAG: SpoVT / AbrB like domain protein [Candidatus Bathyarchaeota archaeon BA1]|nr:MAG: SpoVT / AbrB like domain protein [Candidatus Bathyarchaeota archaeon BA1]
MRFIVKVTRRGQTTIPIEFRKKYGIREGDELVVEAMEEGLLFKVIPKLEELAGVDAKFGKVEEIKQEIERLREEY